MNQLGEYQGLCPLCYMPVTVSQESRTLGLDTGDRRETYHASCVNDFVKGNSTERERSQSVGLSLLEEYKELIIGRSNVKRENWISQNKSDWEWTGQSCKLQREEYGISLKHLAEAMGVSVGRVKRFEAGEPVRDARMLCQCYISLLYIYHLEQRLKITTNELESNQNELLGGEQKVSDIISFKDYVQSMGGSGIIYEEECRSILRDWKGADWIGVDDYIAPIVSEILIDASENNRPLYEKLMNVVMEAHQELRKELGYTPERPKLIRIK